MTVAFDTVTALLALVLLGAGLAKLAGTARMREGAEHFAIPWRRYRLIGVAEIVAVAGLAVGLAWRPVGVAAAVGSGLLMLGALIVHRRAGDPAREMTAATITLALAAACVVVGLM